MVSIRAPERKILLEVLTVVMAFAAYWLFMKLTRPICFEIEL